MYCFKGNGHEDFEDEEMKDYLFLTSSAIIVDTKAELAFPFPNDCVGRISAPLRRLSTSLSTLDNRSATLKPSELTPKPFPPSAPSVVKALSKFWRTLRKTCCFEGSMSRTRSLTSDALMDRRSREARTTSDAEEEEDMP